jgi:hypothetical protein
MVDGNGILIGQLLSILLASDAAHAIDGGWRRTFPILSHICDTDEVYRRQSGSRAGLVLNAQIGRLMSAGKLSRARRIAYECLALIHGGNDDGADFSRHCCPSTQEEVGKTYISLADAFFHENDDFLGIIVKAHSQDDGDAEISASSTPSEWGDGRKASDVGQNEGLSLLSFGQFVSAENQGIDSYMSRGSAVIDRWNKCCSFFRPPSTEYACYDTTHSEKAILLCELSEVSDNHLILPALREPEVNVLLRFRDTINGSDRAEIVFIEQEGSLRMYDVSGVLWPAGYLLGLCLSNPIACGVPEVLDAMTNDLNSHRPLAVELGAGVGFPSIAFSKALRSHNYEASNNPEVCDQRDNSPLIAAIDISNSSVALIASNAQNNGVGRDVIAMRVNQSDITALSRLSERFASSGGFDVVIGSSLQALFDGTTRQNASLWQTLGALLSNKNGNAIVVLSHVKTGDERIDIPPESEFECVRRISGDHFGMKTRDGHSSDFELVILRRKRRLGKASPP